MPLFVLPILSAIMSPIWGFLKALWATEFGRICIVGLVCLTVGWLRGYAHVPGAVKKAEERRDLHWTQQIEKANNDHKRELQDALDEASKVAPVDPTRDARVKLCRDRATGADCREHGQRM
jgi:hypothetical protein